MSEAVGKFERETGRFNPQKSFFVLDSNHLDNAETKLYGYTFVNDKIVDNAEALNGSSPEKEGAWVYLLREGNCLTIRQDYLGCYGLYYYQKEDYFAVSNSFLNSAISMIGISCITWAVPETSNITCSCRV